MAFWEFHRPQNKVAVIADPQILCVIADCGSIKESYFLFYEKIIMTPELYIKALDRISEESLTNVSDIDVIDIDEDQQLLDSLNSSGEKFSMEEAKCVSYALNNKADVIIDELKKMKVIADLGITVINPADILFYEFNEDE